MSKWLALRPWGIRSRVLVLIGTIWAAIGIHYIVSPWTTDARAARALALFLVDSHVFWGALFLGIGVLACISSRWPPHQDTWGYVGLVGTSTFWACVNAAGAFSTDLVKGATGALVWAALAYLLYSISLLAEPARKRRK